MRSLYHFLAGTLRGRLILGVAAVHAVMMALFVADLTERQRTMLLERQVEEAEALSQTLATSAAGWVAAHDISGLQELAEAQRRYPELLFAMLADQQGLVLADTDRSRIGQYLLDLPRDAHQTVLSGVPALVDVAAPAIVGGRHVGWARVGIGQKAAGQKLAEITRNGIAYALAAIFVGSVIAWFMGRKLTRRLYAVLETMTAVRAGNRMARSRIVGGDESAAIALEFNSMLDAIAGRDAELRASEKRNRRLIRRVPTAIVLHDGQGRVLDSNPLAQELLGFSADELMGKALIDPDGRFLREDGSVLPIAEYPVSLVLSTRQPLRDYVLGIKRPNRDEVTWLLVNAEPDFDDAQGLERAIVSFVDISARRRAQEDLRRANQRFSLAANAAHLGVWDWDIERNELVWDDGTYALYGLRKEDFPGAYEAWLHCVHPEDRAASEEMSELARRGERDYDTEFRVVWPDGSIHWLKAYGQVVREAAGRPLRMTGVKFDISERKRAEQEIRQLNSELEQRVAERTAELQSSNKEMEAFCYSVSHDLRAPLRHIDGYVDLLVSRCRDGLSEKGLHYVDTIAASARRMGQLIDDLLQFSRTGRAELHQESVDMNRALTEALAPLQESCAGRSVEWAIGDLPPACGDYALLRQVWANLLGNAIKYTRTRAHARIEVSGHEQGGESVYVVTDNGVGFDMRYAEKLFVVFHRLHAQEEFEGTGIGLAMVQRIVSRHGGRVWAEAMPEHGASFHFTLASHKEQHHA